MPRFSNERSTRGSCSTADRSELVLRRVAAELRAELAHIDRTVSELGTIANRISNERVVLYAAAALLDTFYTGVEKTFRRIASELGGIPEGSGWHRTLPDDMALDIPKTRPPVLRPDTVRELSKFLAFRHRFRNLYLFDLEPEPIVSLVGGLAPTWAAARVELDAFAGFLVDLANELEP
jgi:hypothetical protein